MAQQDKKSEGLVMTDGNFTLAPVSLQEKFL
jgi:hypothetical protein